MQALCADITTLSVDAIVNAANTHLLGGGGVDGAIHRAAGPDLMEACRKLNGCEVGNAKLTPGFNLPAIYVIHAVGPVWKGGSDREEELLESCYTTALSLARKHLDICSIAFPCISTGVHRVPLEKTAEIAVRACRASSLNVTFCCYLEDDLEIYQRLLAEA